MVEGIRQQTEAEFGRRSDGRSDTVPHDKSVGSLDGKVALVTGASRGLGRAVALAFAREGAALAICARGPQPLAQLAAEIAASGGDVLAIPADMRQERDLDRLVGLTLERFTRIDILINNASELGPTPLPFLADYPPAAFDDVFAVNLIAPFRLTQAVIGGMLLRDRGMIINVTSDAATTGYPGWGAYAVSKAALEGLTRTWAAELAGTAVRMYVLDPGDMDTDMHRAAIPDADRSQLAQPENVARAFVRLVSDSEPARAGERLEAAAFGG